MGHQCPECVATGRRSQRPARTTFGGGTSGARGYVTIGLIVVNCLVALAAALSAGTSGALFGQGMAGLLGGSTPLHTRGALYTPLIANGQYYRLVTSMFLHYGLLHLAMNMWALWVLGRLLETVLGPLRFLVLYLLAGFGGSVAVYLFANPHAATVGASGAIFGLFGGLFVILRRLGRNASSILPVLLINLVITFTVPGISIEGHLGGLVTGALVAVGMAYAPPQWRTKVQVAVATAVGVILVLATVARTAMIAGGVA